jgi:hypothetical protein
MIVAYLQKGSALKEQGRIADEIRSAACMSRIHHNELTWFQAAVRRRSDLLARAYAKGEQEERRRTRKRGKRRSLTAG